MHIEYEYAIYYVIYLVYSKIITLSSPLLPFPPPRLQCSIFLQLLL